MCRATRQLTNAGENPPWIACYCFCLGSCVLRVYYTKSYKFETEPPIRELELNLRVKTFGSSKVEHLASTLGLASKHGHNLQCLMFRPVLPSASNTMDIAQLSIESRFVNLNMLRSRSNFVIVWHAL